MFLANFIVDNYGWKNKKDADGLKKAVFLPCRFGASYVRKQSVWLVSFRNSSDYTYYQTPRSDYFPWQNIKVATRDVIAVRRLTYY